MSDKKTTEQDSNYNHLEKMSISELLININKEDKTVAFAVEKAIPDAYINGGRSKRLPGIVNVTFPGTQSDTLLLLLDNAHVSASTGSACSAGVHEASHVLLAMGHNETTAQSSLRFSFGAESTQEDVDFVMSVLPGVIATGRAANNI